MHDQNLKRRVNLHRLTCSAVGLASASFCKQASTNEQNSGENLCFDGDGDGSSKIYRKGKEFRKHKKNATLNKLKGNLVKYTEQISSRNGVIHT